MFQAATSGDFKKAHKILKIEERQTFYPGEAEKFLPPEHRET